MLLPSLALGLLAWQEPAPALPETLPQSLAASPWQDTVELSASLRLRAESTLDQPGGEDRTRGRLRFRLGAQAQVAEGLQAEVRLSTASGDANNPHWDLGASNGNDTVSGADVVLDRLNLSWDSGGPTSWRAGKMGNPLATNPIYGEWLWDGDIQPAGVAARWAPGGPLGLRAAHFVLDEENGAGNASDPAVTIVQVQGQRDLHGVTYQLHSALWNFTNEGPAQAQVWNTVLAASQDSWDASIQAFRNLDDETGQDRGLALGLRGRLGQGDSLFASYFDFEANAHLWAFAQDDVPLTPGARDLTGFLAGYEHAWNERTRLRLWVLQGDDGLDDPLRLRFDVNVAF